MQIGVATRKATKWEEGHGGPPTHYLGNDVGLQVLGQTVHVTLCLKVVLTTRVVDEDFKPSCHACVVRAKKGGW